MKAKEYLRQVKKLDKMIQNKMVEVEQWKTIATGTTVSLDDERVQSSSSQQKMADAVSKYVDIQNEITADIDRLVDIKKDVVSMIEHLPTTEYDVLHKVYIQYKSLYEVAEIYEKTYSWITTVHGKALKDLQDMLDERCSRQ